MHLNPAKTRVTFDLRPGPRAARLPRNTVCDGCHNEFVPWCAPLAWPQQAWHDAQLQRWTAIHSLRSPADTQPCAQLTDHALRPL